MSRFSRRIRTRFTFQRMIHGLSMAVALRHGLDGIRTPVSGLAVPIFHLASDSESVGTEASDGDIRTGALIGTTTL